MIIFNDFSSHWKHLQFRIQVGRYQTYFSCFWQLLTRADKSIYTWLPIHFLSFHFSRVAKNEADD